MVHVDAHTHTHTHTHTHMLMDGAPVLPDGIQKEGLYVASCPSDQVQPHLSILLPHLALCDACADVRADAVLLCAALCDGGLGR